MVLKACSSVNRLEQNAFCFFGESSRGYVYRGQNLAQLHTKLLNEGFISAAGKYYDTAIYHLKINGKEAFLAKTPFDYLLASSSKKQLIRMLDTGSGIAGSILDDQEYFESINLAIKGGHEWEHYNSRKSFASLLEEVRNHSETTQEVKDFEEFVSSIETQVIAYHFSDRLKNKH